MDHQTGVERRAGAAGCAPQPAGQLGGGSDAARCVPNAVRRGGKAALIGTQARLAKTGALIQRGHQRKPQPGVLGRVGQGPTHGQRVVIRAAVQIMLQVVKLTYLGVTTPQQLQVQHRSDGALLRGRDAQRHAVHAVTPRPKIIGRRFTPLGQPGKRALERMAMGVDQARQQRAGQHVRTHGRPGHAGAHLGPAAINAQPQQDMLGPASRQPGAGRPDQIRHRWRCGATHGAHFKHRAPSAAGLAAGRAAAVEAAQHVRYPVQTAAPHSPHSCSTTSTSPAARRARPARAGRSGG